MPLIRLHIYISGRVQGVYYRSSAQREARKLGLAGWIKNLRDGRVESVIEGEEDEVLKLMEWLKIGPPRAIVRNIEIIEENPSNKFTDFHITFDLDSPN
jgi:acylphosphatase